MTRQLIGDVRWATKIDRDSLPFRLTNPRRKVARAGLSYERAFAAAVPFALHGQWIKYCDGAGVWYCQPDFILEFDRFAVVIECKLKWTEKALGQLELYEPVVEKAFEKRTFGLTLTKSLHRIPFGTCVVGSLEEAITSASCRRPVILHWLGNEAQLGLAA